MKPETVLPREFTGVFYFTNSWEDREFVGIWGKKEYHFPPYSTSPMLMPEHSPIEIMQIRKKFALDWAEQDFYRNSEHYKQLLAQERTPEGVAKLNSIHQAAVYTDSDLIAGIQKCIKPLPISHATVTPVMEMPMEDKMSRNEENELNTVAVDKKTSLKNKALRGESL